MKKFFLRAAVLLLVFISAFALYYMTIEEHTSATETTSTGTSSIRLPVLSFVVNGNEINLTEGYTIAMDENYPRSSVTPVSTEQRLGVLIDEKESSVRKLEAEVLELPGFGVLEKKEVSAFEREEGRLAAEYIFEETLVPDTEYLLKLTITDASGKHIYYYTRLQVANYGSLSGSLDFINNFHELTFDKERVYELETYMETDDDLTNNDLGHVSIKDDLDTLSYGTLEVSEVYRYVPTICEYNKNFVSANIFYWLTAYTDEGLETYQCKEGYRLRYSEARTILYNYERSMDSLFNGAFLDPVRSRMKLGISSDKDVDTLYSDNRKQLLFSYQGGLWHLDMEKNRLISVLSYRDDKDHDRQPEPEYDFTMLSLDDEGNADFAVYGRIGRGSYEGRMGILYYHYYAAEGRIEERMYIPMNLGLAEMSDAFGRVSFTSDMGIFYFTLFDSYYSYELDTNVLHTEKDDLGENWLYFEDSNLIVYNEEPDVSLNKSIVIRTVGGSESRSIKAAEGRVIDLLGAIDGRIVYGNADPTLISFFDDGSRLLPYESIMIAELDGTVVEEYTPGEGLYVGSAGFESGLIALYRYELLSSPKDNDKAVFGYHDRDVIINLNTHSSTSKSYTSEYDTKARLEYYLTLPQSYSPEKLPARSEALTTVITKDTAASVITGRKDNFHAYAYGSELMASTSLADCLLAANENAGTVTDAKGRVIWRRSIVSDEKTIDGINIVSTAEDRNCEQAVLQMLMDYYGVEGDAREYSMAEKSLYEWLLEKLGGSATLAEKPSLPLMLYFVSDGDPLIVSYLDHYVVITAYTNGTVSFLDPTTGEKKRMRKSEAEEAFLKAGGSYYLVY